MIDRSEGSTGRSPNAISIEIWQKACTVVPQTLICGALVYSLFFAGATATTTQYHTCLLLVVAIVVSLLRPESVTFRRPKVMLVLFSALSLWLFFTAFQSMILSQGTVGWLSPATIDIHEQFSGAVAVAPSMSISLVPSVSRLAWPKYAIAFAFFLMGTCLWQTRESRTALLVVIGATGAMLSIWGVSSSLTNDSVSTNFASIAYRNSAASYFIASIAVSLGLLLNVLRPVLRPSQSNRKKSRSQREKYKNESRKLRKSSSASAEISGDDDSIRKIASPQHYGGKVSRTALSAVSLCSLILLIGLIWTQSGLAWIAALVSVATWGFTMRKYIPPKSIVVVACLTLLIALIAIYVRSSVASESETMLASQQLDSRTQFTHWNQTWDRVFEFPIFGIGLGNYELAQLVKADTNSKFFFTHAYNQPLEWMFESGILGALLLTTASLAVLFVLFKLYRKRNQGFVFLIWFTVAFVSIGGITIQSFFDFAVITPAVLWTYALLFGVVVNIRRESRSKSDREMRSHTKKSDDGLEYSSWERFVEFSSTKFSRPFTWTLVTAIMLLLGQRWLQEDILDKAVLRSTQLPASVKAPTQTQVDLARKKLLARAKAHPTNGELWQRLAAWDIAEYRLRLIALNKKRNISLTWLTSTPQNMFETYHSMPAERKASAIQNWVFDDTQRALVDDAKKHFTRALQNNPLSARIHHQIALISPLTQDDHLAHTKLSRDLAVMDPALQRENGAMAMHLGDTESMIDQWRKCLRTGPENVRQVIGLAKDRLSPQEIADKVMPDLSSDAWVSVVRSSYREKQLEPFQSSFLEGARRAVRADESIQASKRHFLLAQLAEFEGDQEAATHQFREAVRADPANANYQHHLAVTLVAQGDYDQAREAVSIGRTLEPNGERWQKLDAQLNELSPATEPAS